MLDKFSFAQVVLQAVPLLTQKGSKGYLKLSLLQENSFKLLLFAGQGTSGTSTSGT